MAAKPKYNAPYHDNWAWSLAAMGATNEEIALAMGVSERTIMRWAKEHESFGKALGEGKGVSDAKVIRSLYERATGYEYEEEKKIIEYVWFITKETKGGLTYGGECKMQSLQRTYEIRGRVFRWTKGQAWMPV